ncbi:unnamed protein product, partial [marine sediment metagenome]
SASITITGVVLGATYEWYVDSDAASIQDAIDSASAGDTIHVAAGEYSENVVIVADKDGLQLVGAGSGVTSIATASGNPLTLKGNSPGKPLDGITIKGFTLTTASNDYKLIAQSETSLPYSYDTTNLILEDIVVDGGQRGICLNQVQEVDLIDVHISNITGEAGDGALELTAVSDLTFTGGSITGNTLGVRLQVHEPYGPNGDIDIHFSSLTGNTLAVENQDIFDIDATNNWWGDASGPDDDAGVINGSGDKISINVDAQPWYATATTREGVYVTVKVGGTDDVRAYSDTIQGGIDVALDGDTINVAAGDYDAFVVDDRDDLSIIG